ncbi:PEP-CTERM sorting domain-containing protein [Nostoc sp. TCL26-01]|uniref:PEP-CTERM sorting domain-containing protein n=1 Tax=Nostoc sp. TCL26-01 TaxID=2576904 RepID=UPI0015BB06A9|nr:PEP-CTERM sorting domain-containing protein [Nostoc sp. TCL26-01]QLE58341.1 PEP-CTERM sorting domain-containing protein [Nostoc sp. TCL26-01]
MNHIIFQKVLPIMNKVGISVIASIASSLLLTHSTYAATLGQNLIVNGDAEQGLGDPIGDAVGTNIPLIPGWNTTGDFSVLKYGATGFNFTNALGNLVSVTLPAIDVTGPTNRGQNLFFGGAGRRSSSAFQSIDVNSLASVIDTSRAVFDLSGWLGGYATDLDIASIEITFLDQTGKPIDIDLPKPSISAPTPTQRNEITGLFFQSTNGYIPVGTRKIDVVLNAAYSRGRVNDAYADNLSLVITQVPENNVPSLMFIGVFCFAVWKLPKKHRVSQQA